MLTPLAGKAHFPSTWIVVQKVRSLGTAKASVNYKIKCPCKTLRMFVNDFASAMEHVAECESKGDANLMLEFVKMVTNKKKNTRPNYVDLDTSDEGDLMSGEEADEASFEPVGNAERTTGDSICAVCFDMNDTAASTLIVCEGCELAVHPKCYGVKVPLPDEWFCASCSEDTGLDPRKQCRYCVVSGGALQSVPAESKMGKGVPNQAHTACVWELGGVSLSHRVDGRVEIGDESVLQFGYTQSEGATGSLGGLGSLGALGGGDVGDVEGAGEKEEVSRLTCARGILDGKFGWFSDNISSGATGILFCDWQGRRPEICVNPGRET